jgi:hypothetical protein
MTTGFSQRSIDSEVRLLREQTWLPIATEHHTTYLLDCALCDFAEQFGAPPHLRRAALFRSTKYINAFRDWVRRERPILAQLVDAAFPRRHSARRPANDEPYLARCLAYYDVRREAPAAAAMQQQ